MSDLHGAMAAALAVEMRTPLARIELAASRLAREATTPGARELAAGISDAVGDLDRMIGRALRLLVPAAVQPAAAALAPVLEEIAERLGPTFGARGVDLEVTGGADGVRGDAELLRHATMALLRAGASLAGSGGVLRLGLVPDADRYALTLGVQTTAGALAARDLHPLVEASRLFVLARGGPVDVVEVVEVAQEPRLHLWLPQEAACVAS